jgi:hypothetical protein
MVRLLLDFVMQFAWSWIAFVHWALRQGQIHAASSPAGLCLYQTPFRMASRKNTLTPYYYTAEPRLTDLWVRGSLEEGAGVRNFRNGYPYALSFPGRATLTSAGCAAHGDRGRSNLSVTVPSTKTRFTIARGAGTFSDLLLWPTPNAR